MGPTFLESLWIAAYTKAFDRLWLERSQGMYGTTRTEATIGAQAAEIADAAVVNTPGSSVAALQALIAGLK